MEGVEFLMAPWSRATLSALDNLSRDFPREERDSELNHGYWSQIISQTEHIGCKKNACVKDRWKRFRSVKDNDSYESLMFWRINYQDVCSSVLSDAVIKPWPKEFGKDLDGLSFRSIEGSQRQKPGGKNRGGLLLAGSLSGSFTGACSASFLIDYHSQ